MSHLDNDFRQIFLNLFYPERERRLDIEKWVDYCARAGATSVCMDIITQAYALYNSKIIQKDPVIGKRDFAAELSRAARKKGLKWCAYIPPYTMESLWDAGREWQEKLEDGSVFAEQGTGFMKTCFCWNSPYLDLLCSVLKEIASTYKPDGFYLDGMRYHQFQNQLTCYCGYCRARFLREYGLPLPSQKKDPGRRGKSWILFLQARKKWIADAARAIRSTVNSVDPDIALYLNNKYGGGDWANSNGPDVFAPIDCLCRETIPQVVRGSLLYATYGFSAGDQFMWTCAAQRAGKQGKPGQIYVALSPVARAADICLTVDLACAVGASLAMAETRSDTRTFLARIKVMEPYLKDIMPLADIAIHYAESSQLAYYRPQVTGNNHFTREPAGLYKTILDLHRPAELVTDDDLMTGDCRGARLLILPNSAVLPKESKEKIQAHLDKGGSVIASMAAGTLDEFGGTVTDKLVYENSGLKLKGAVVTRKPFYMKRENGKLVFEDPVSPHPAQYLVFKEGSARKWLGEDIAVVDRPEPVEERWAFQLRGTPSVFLPADALRITADKTWKILAAIRYREDASGRWKESPAIVSRKVGRGSLIYVAFQFGSLLSEKSLLQDIGYAWSRHLIAHLIDAAIGPARIKIEAPSCVKAAFWKQGDKTLVHLVNELSGFHPAVPLEERLPVALRVEVPDSAYKTVRVEAGRSGWAIKRTKNGTTLTHHAFKERMLFSCR